MKNDKENAPNERNNSQRTDICTVQLDASRCAPQCYCLQMGFISPTNIVHATQSNKCAPHTDTINIERRAPRSIPTSPPGHVTADAHSLINWWPISVTFHRKRVVYLLCQRMIRFRLLPCFKCGFGFVWLDLASTIPLLSALTPSGGIQTHRRRYFFTTTRLTRCVPSFQKHTKSQYLFAEFHPAHA